jgi:hypothetical protein
MDMSCRTLGGDVFTLTGICPHCHSKAVFLAVTNSHEEEFDYMWHRELYAGMQCQGCGGFILGCVAKSEEHGKWEYRLHYPLGTPDDTVADEIPPHIASDFSEALRCLWVKAYRATVAMCARALQTSCDEKEAKGGTLNKQIDDLGSRGVITEPLRQWAHQVRLTRNRELHETTDDPDTAIGEKDAESIVAFTREYFHHVYVMPALLKAYTEPEKPQESG